MPDVLAVKVPHQSALSMDEKRFQEIIHNHPRPLIVDFWAGWCMPCRAMEPALKRVEKEFAGRVDLLRIDADDSPELLAALRIFGIPTLIVFHGGREVARQSGAQNEAAIRRLFEAALAGQLTGTAPLSPLERAVRLVAGIGLIGLGLTLSGGWIWIALGALVSFTAVYDRCPIWRAVTGWLKGRLAN